MRPLAVLFVAVGSTLAGLGFISLHDVEPRVWPVLTFPLTRAAVAAVSGTFLVVLGLTVAVQRSAVPPTRRARAPTARSRLSGEHDLRSAPQRCSWYQLHGWSGWVDEDPRRVLYFPPGLGPDEITPRVGLEESQRRRCGRCGKAERRLLARTLTFPGVGPPGWRWLCWIRHDFQIQQPKARDGKLFYLQCARCGLARRLTTGSASP